MNIKEKEESLLDLNNIYNMDCIDGLKQLPAQYIDLIIADPPYNLSKSGDWKWDNSVTLEGMGGNWNITNQNWDNLSLGEYFNFTIAWLSEARRVLKKNRLDVDFRNIS